MLAASRAQGLEGIVAKRLDCPYVPGRRSNGWVKVKNKKHGRRGGRRLDAAARAAAPAGSARSSSASTRTASFIYAGRVGSGFTEAELKRVQALLEPLARDTQPVHGRAEAAQAGACSSSPSSSRASSTAT